MGKQYPSLEIMFYLFICSQEHSVLLQSSFIVCLFPHHRVREAIPSLNNESWKIIKDRHAWIRREDTKPGFIAISQWAQKHMAILFPFLSEIHTSSLEHTLLPMWTIAWLSCTSWLMSTYKWVCTMLFLLGLGYLIQDDTCLFFKDLLIYFIYMSTL